MSSCVALRPFLRTSTCVAHSAHTFTTTTTTQHAQTRLSSIHHTHTHTHTQTKANRRKGCMHSSRASHKHTCACATHTHTHTHDIPSPSRPVSSSRRCVCRSSSACSSSPSLCRRNVVPKTCVKCVRISPMDSGVTMDSCVRQIQMEDATHV